MNERTKLLHCYSAEQFAAWELHLFLDTHPDDKSALRLYDRHNARAMELKKEFEEKFGPLLSESAEGCAWLKDPWPWEKGGC
ncbi:MAG: spore coat protein CotJB [Clostridiales bacterium]|nr:spore coat protein CotJB [Clostridiales bacterium]MCD7827675.1 spore coat protein CotJB [Clostridiales bacterium]